MKKIKYPIIALGLLFLAYCKTTKKSEAPPSPLKEAYVPSVKQLEVVEKRWPSTSPDDIKMGQSIFVTKCTECHQAYEITGFSEKKWLHEIEDMSPKAKLTAVEKLQLTKHILSYREANTVVKAK